MFPAVGLLGNCCINRAELCSCEGWSSKSGLQFLFSPQFIYCQYFSFGCFTDKIGWWTLTTKSLLSSLSDYNLDLIDKLSLNSEIQNTDKTLLSTSCSELTFCIGEYFLNLPKDRVGLLTSVHLGVQAPRLVVTHQGLGQGVILVQPLGQHLGVVIASSDQRLPGDVVFAGHSGRVELFVIGPAAGKMEPSTTDSLHCNKGQLIHGNCDLNIMVSKGMYRSKYYWPSKLSSMANSTTASSGSFLFSSITSSFSAWPMVRGKPSRRKPFLHSDLSRLSDTIRSTSSSLTCHKCQGNYVSKHHVQISVTRSSRILIKDIWTVSGIERHDSCLLHSADQFRYPFWISLD